MASLSTRATILLSRLGLARREGVVRTLAADLGGALRGWYAWSAGKFSEPEAESI